MAGKGPQYRWFVRELSRILRHDRGAELALHLELFLLKWQSYGLDSHQMQSLICEVFKRFRMMQTPEKSEPWDPAEDERASQEPASTVAARLDPG